MQLPVHQRNNLINNLIVTTNLIMITIHLQYYSPSLWNIINHKFINWIKKIEIALVMNLKPPFIIFSAYSLIVLVIICALEPAIPHLCDRPWSELGPAWSWWNFAPINLKQEIWTWVRWVKKIGVCFASDSVSPQNLDRVSSPFQN